jgi:hypothetical protein
MTKLSENATTAYNQQSAGLFHAIRHANHLKLCPGLAGECPHRRMITPKEELCSQCNGDKNQEGR